MAIRIPSDGKVVFDSAPAEKTLFITGDLIPRVLAETNLIAGNLEAVFGTVLPEIRSSDLAVTNLETALTRGGAPIRKFGPPLRSDPDSLTGLVKAGFSVFSLANNHTRDFGDEAFLETMRHIQDANARFVGGGKNRAEAALPLRLKLGSFRVSIFAAALNQPCTATTSERMTITSVLTADECGASWLMETPGSSVFTLLPRLGRLASPGAARVLPDSSARVFPDSSALDGSPALPHNPRAMNTPRPSLSVVIPVYNEKATILEIIDRVLEQPEVDEIVLVDDFSTDGTRDILRAQEGRDKLRVLFHARNQGKGAALRTAFGAATKDLVLIQDADLEYDPSDYPHLLAPIYMGRADAVFGSRFLGGTHRVLYFWHYLANRFLTLLSNVFTGLNLTDMEVCYKVFRREHLQRMTIVCDRFGIEPELTAKIARMRGRIYEVPVSYYGRTYDEGKKIGWKDGVSAIYWIVRFGLIRTR